MANSVLIVDDEPRITAAMMLRLEAAGYQVFHAINGLAGLEAASFHKPDVIVLDVRMPDIDGIEVCRRLKSTPDLAAIPIVFLTANVAEPIRKLAYQSGGRAFLSKPFEIKDVIAAIERVTAQAA